MTVLEATAVTKSFRGLQALRGVDISVDEGQILGIIGANGAGKTTLFNCITGAFPPTSGTVRLDGQDITGRQRRRTEAREGVPRATAEHRVDREAPEDRDVGAQAHGRGADPERVARSQQQHLV